MVKTEAAVREAVLKYIDRLERDIRVQRAIVFGSYARGNPRDYSDIDVAIISDDLAGMDFVERQEFLGLGVIGCDPFIEPIGFTTAECQRPRGHPLLAEILRTGKAVYEAEDSPGRAD